MSQADHVPDDFDPGLAALGSWSPPQPSDQAGATNGSARSESPDQHDGPPPDTAWPPTIPTMTHPEQPDAGRQVHDDTGTADQPDVSRTAASLTAIGRDLTNRSQSMYSHRDGFQAKHIDIHYNYGGQSTPTASTAVRRHVLDWEYVHAESERAVLPPNLDDATACLTARRLVVVTAGPHEGSETACLCLARGLADQLDVKPTVERIPAESDESVTAWLARNWTSSGMVLIDLLDATARQVDAAVDDLGAVPEVLAGTDSYLVLVVAREQHDRFVNRYPNRVVALCRPDAFKVFGRHLGSGVPADLTTAIRSDEWFNDQLRVAWPPRAAHLATMVTECVDNGTTELGTIRQWVEAALSDWSTQLRDDLESNPQPWPRTLLFAAAALEGAEPDTVVRAARSMIGCAGYSDLDEPHPLVAPSVISRIGQAPGVAADINQVGFDRPEFGRSVLPHVWVEYPPLRGPMRRWLAAMPAELPMSRAVLERLADRVAELATVRGASIALSLAKAWAVSDERSQVCRSVAVRLLTATGTDSQIGRQVRDQLWQWAHSSTDRGLQLVLVEVCGGQYGQVFPRNALTRLKHLARSSDPEVRQATVAAVARIGTSIGLHRFLSYLSDWMPPLPYQEQALTEAVGSVLAESSAPADLPAAARYRHGVGDGPVTRFWATALTHLSYPQAGALVDRWLTAASQLPPDDGQLLAEQLVQGAANNWRPLGQLMYAVGGLAMTSTHNERMARLLRQVRTRLDELDAALWTKHSREDQHGGR